MTHRLRDLFRDAHIVTREIDVERNQRSARADDRCTRLRKFARTIIGFAIRIRLDFNFESFVLPLADVFEIRAFGTRCRRFI